MFNGLKCIYCGYQMTMLGRDDVESVYICDCGAHADEDEFSVAFALENENRTNIFNREFFEGLAGI